MGAIAVVHGRRGLPDLEAARRMLAAVPHRGDGYRLEACGPTVVGVAFDPEFPNASVATGDGLMVALAGTLDDIVGTDQRGPLGADGLLGAWRRWGPGCLPRLRGAFAGAVVDGGTLHVFRDQFGSRPLFHRLHGDTFYAASEVKQVAAGAGIAAEVDLEHLERVVYGGIQTSTAVRGVSRLARGTMATVDGGLDARRYWDPDAHVETVRMSFADACEGFADALERATTRMLRGRDVVLLSGGLDSTAIAAFAAPHGATALTALYPDHPSVDEGDWTRMAAGHLGMPLRAFDATASSLDDVDTWVQRLDGPVDVVSIPEQAEALRHVRALGGRVALSGEVAEYLLECRAYLLDHLLSHGRLGAAAQLIRARRLRGRAVSKIARDVASAVAPGFALTAYGRRRAARDGVRGVPSWMDAGRFVTDDDGPSTAAGPRHRWARLQTTPLHGPGMATEMDEIAAAHCGVDVRRPFTDVDLWTFVLSLPAEVKFPDMRTKSLLRDGMRGKLPDAILDRTDKTYFDSYHLSKADYPVLRRWLVGAGFRLPGIDYAALEKRIEAGDMTVTELQWARDLVRIHAFVDRSALTRV